MAGRPIRIAIIANGRGGWGGRGRPPPPTHHFCLTAASAGKLVAGAFAISTLTRATAAIIKTGDAYTSQLAKIEALSTKADRAQIGGMQGVAKQLEAQRAQYAKYGSTVGDAAAGVTELVKAGQTLPNALKSVNATLVLAKAGEMDVASASSIVATTLTTFHLKAQRAGDVANYLANAANISTADVTDLGYALKFVAPSAAKAGLSAQRTAAYLAQLSNAGINGTDAGTGLRKVIESLQAPTGKAAKVLENLGVKVFTAEGKARPLGNVLRELRDKLAGVNDQTRKMDMRAIFGLTGITSASVILDNVDAIGTYTKGVERAGAAQKLAAANSAGLAGTIRRTKALLVSDLQGIYRASQPVINGALKPMADWLEKNDSRLQAEAKTIASRLLPALKTTGEAFKGAVDDAKPLLSTVETLAKLALKGAEAFGEIPGPIKKIGIEVGIAALIMPRLTAGVTSVTASMATGIGTMAMYSRALLAAETRSTALGLAWLRMGPAVKSLAGAGGMVALTQSASESNKGIAALERTAGLAAMGFAVGGPWGAAIGAGAGALWSLKSAFTDTAGAARKAAQEAANKSSWATATKAANDLTEALRGTVSAYGETAKAAVQASFKGADGQIKPWVKQLTDAGVSMETLTRAALGQASAQVLVRDANAKVITNLKGLEKAAVDAEAALSARARGEFTPRADGRVLSYKELKKAAEAARTAFDEANNSWDQGSKESAKLALAAADAKHNFGQMAAQLGLSRAEYAKFPKDARISFAVNGLPQTREELVSLAKQTKMVPKDIVTVIKASRVDLTMGQLKALGVSIDALPKKTETKVEVTGIDATKKKAVAAAVKVGAAVGVEGAKAAKTKRPDWSGAGTDNVNGYVGSITSGWGRSYAAGYTLAAQAVAGAKAGQDSHSPSKKARKLGKWFTQGYSLGIRDDAQKVIDASKAMVSKATGSVSKLRLKQTKSIVSSYETKTPVALIKANSALAKTYPSITKGLKGVAAAQAAVSAALEDAQSNLVDAKQAWTDYFNTVKTGIVNFGDVTQVGKNSAGNATADGIVKALRVRAQAVADYVAKIKDLAAKGLNSTAIQQILDAGVDGGLQTALAIEAGGAQTISDINDLQAQIEASGSSLGTAMADKYKLAGVQAAQGLVDGLTAKQADLDAVAKKMADSLVTSVKKALKIKSPSRIFRQIGDYTIQGLEIGLDDRRMTSAGQSLASSLTSGFGTPALDALMSGSGSASLTVQPISISLTAAQADALRAGREIQAQIDVANAVGIRRAA